MLTYLRHLPEKDLAERKRFVVVATTISFLLIVLLWTAVRFAGRRTVVTPPSPSPETSSPSPAIEPSPGLSATPPVLELLTTPATPDSAEAPAALEPSPLFTAPPPASAPPTL